MLWKLWNRTKFFFFVFSFSSFPENYFTSSSLSKHICLLYFVFERRQQHKFIQVKQKTGIVTSLDDTQLAKVTYGKTSHPGSGWSGVWNRRVVYFPVKHTPAYNKFHFISGRKNRHCFTSLVLHFNEIEMAEYFRSEHFFWVVNNHFLVVFF